jgi:radical SAM-linked protein
VRIRVRYSKTGKVRYVSAIDLGRIWERALRRADLPIAYSEGFSPHPKVSFPDALPLGYGSYAEYAELTFAGPIAIEPAIRSLNAAFPAGIAVRAAVEVQEGDPRLAKWLRASLWELVYPAEAAPALAAAVPVLRDADTIPVARERKGEFTETDLRPALHKIHQSSQTFDDAEGSRACVRVVFNHTANVASEETRRTAIAESPPASGMLVTVGTERTQIAVLEERTLVEHYVTRKSDVSYVGNIYKGRVQNVLPGMEAAFVDIGKGRNGVLYAGEVNYDEADLDGGLPRIEQTLKPGQTVLVQVTKDPMGTKGARLTQHLSIAGRYCVLAPGEDMLGISRKLPDDERDRLRASSRTSSPRASASSSAPPRRAPPRAARGGRRPPDQRWEQVEERAEKAKPLEPVYEPSPTSSCGSSATSSAPEYTELIIDDAGAGRAGP